MFALDSRCILLADDVLLGGDMPLVRAPSIRVAAGNTKGLQEVLECKKDLSLAPSKDIRQPGATVGIDGMPQPPLAFMAISTICCFTAGDCPAYVYAKRNVRPRSGHARHR